MKWSAREQCQPHFTRCGGLPLSESSRELLESFALPDQRSSTDFKPDHSPLQLPEGAGESRLFPRRSWMQPQEHLSWCWGCHRPLGRGGCPLPAMGCQMHVAEILENGGEIFADGAERSVASPFSGYGWKQWYLCGDPRCWEAPEHPPAASLLMGLLPMEGKEKVIFPSRCDCSWWKEAFVGEEGISKAGPCQTLSRLARAPVVVLMLLHCAVASTL